MTIWAIVPVKPLRLGKSRLSGVLSDDERAVLNRSLFEQTLNTLQQTPEISQTLVVSRDPAALAIARQYGARTILEDGTPNLNGALTRATMLARNYATRGVLILPADLPLLTKEDLFSFLEFVREAPCVVIAPDRHNNGTNALLVAPGGLIKYDFGPGSFERHCADALKKGAKLEVMRNPHITLDLDTPDDFKMLKQIEKSKA
jgi:2-phospho-L-lactate/phosphoenolpyruvate guanylyltransferase